MKRQVSSAKSSNRSYGSYTGLSPYEKNYKGCLRMEQRELIFEHQRVSKMTRRDLEDHYINLCDEHYAVKRENRFNQEKIKRLITKISRISSLSLSDVRSALNTTSFGSRPRELLSFEEKLQICIFDLECQNSQLNEKLQTICKRNGLPAPPPCRALSEMYGQYSQKELPSNHRPRARSCHHINEGVVNDHSKDEIEHPSKIPAEHPYDNEHPETGPALLVDENIEKINGLEAKNERLAQLLNDFNEQLEKERRLNNEISNRCKELEIRRQISENIELNMVKEKLEQTKGEFKRRLELLEISKNRNENILTEDRLKLAEVKQKLKEELERTKKLKLQLKPIDGYCKQIEDLKEQLIESETEKKTLKSQQERFALLLKESVHQGDRIQTLKDKNTHLQSKLDEAKANEMSVTHAKSELVEKIIKIQDENDRISIELEGLRSLLAQDNEYKMNKQVGSTFTEPKFNLQDVVVNEDQVVRESENRKTPCEKSQASVNLKDIGTNTEPTQVNKASPINTRRGQDRQFSESYSAPESPKNSANGNNLISYDEPLTIDSERSSLIHFAANLKTPKNKKREKAELKNLELLERAALYTSYSGNMVNYNEHYQSLDDSQNNISAAAVVNFTQISLPRNLAEEDHPTLLMDLKTFIFNERPQTGSTYQLEITVSPELSFHSRSFCDGDLQINYQKGIKLTSNILKNLSKTDQPIRFLLLEKNIRKESSSIQSPLSSISSSAPEGTLSVEANLVQCQEIAYGSIRYAELLNSMATTTGSDHHSTAVYEIPFNATRYAHPEIGRLTAQFLIDDVPRVRQLLTNV